MSFVVDTNVLVYAANRDCREHAKCLQLVRDWRRQQEPWYVTWSIVYEYLRVVTHPRVFERPLDVTAAWSFVAVLLETGPFGVLAPTERHEEIASTAWREFPEIGGNLVHDAHTVILMREHGIRRIVTRDSDFHRFPRIEVVDPLRN